MRKLAQFIAEDLWDGGISSAYQRWGLFGVLTLGAGSLLLLTAIIWLTSLCV